MSDPPLRPDAPLMRPGPRRGAWASWKARTRRTKTVLIAVASVLVLSIIGGIAGGGTKAPQQASQGSPSVASPTPGLAVVPAASASPPLAPAQVPTAKPSPKPSPKASTPKPAATKTKAPPKYPPVGGNPWDYNFTCCNYIYSPAASICSYITCIGNFWNGRGYVEECRDGEYGKSGGISGSCSYHGGNLRPLLAP